MKLEMYTRRAVVRAIGSAAQRCARRRRPAPQARERCRGWDLFWPKFIVQNQSIVWSRWLFSTKSGSPAVCFPRTGHNR